MKSGLQCQLKFMLTNEAISIMICITITRGRITDCSLVRCKSSLYYDYIIIIHMQPVINYSPAKEMGLGCSLFERYAQILDEDEEETLLEESLLMLTTQYRMVTI